MATNTGTANLTNATVSDPKISNLSCSPSIPLATLNAGDRIICSGTYLVTAADADAGEVMNTATVEADGVGGSDEESTNTISTGVDPNTSDLSPIITQKRSTGFIDNDADGKVSVGDEINYEITTTNTTNDPITDVDLQDPLISNLTCTPSVPVATLNPSESVVCTGSYTVTQSDDETSVTADNVTSSNFDGVVPFTETVNGVTVDVTKTSGTTSSASGPGGGSLVMWNINNSSYQTMTFEYSQPVYDFSTTAYDIDGNKEYLQIVAYDANGNAMPFDPSWVALGSNLVVNSSGEISPTASAPGGGFGTQASNAATISIPGPVSKVEVNGRETLANGRNFGFTNPAWLKTPSAAVVYVGQVENTATATGTDIDDKEVASTDKSTITVDPDSVTPSFDLTKVLSDWNDIDSDGEINAGDELDYEINVINTGNVSITNTNITDPLIGNLSCNLAGGSTLTPGQVMSCAGTYTITAADFDAEKVVNEAAATATGPNGESIVDKEELTTHTAEPDRPEITAEKDSDVEDTDGSGALSVGDKINYTFKVTNSGNVDLTDITITDPNVTVVGGPISTLAVGVSDAVTFTASYTITQADIDAGEVDNTAGVKFKDPDGVEINSPTSDPTPTDPDNPGVTTQTLDSLSEVSSTKQGVRDDTNGNGTLDAGESINYTYVITNTGNTNVYDALVTEDAANFSGTGTLPSPSYVSGGYDLDGEADDPDLGPGDSVTYAATYVVTQADVDAGEVSNQADVAAKGPGGEEITTTTTDPITGEPITTVPTEVTDMSPSIMVTKSARFNDRNGDGAAQPGETISYGFVVTNNGQTPLKDIRVQDPLVAVSGGPIDLEAGQSNSTEFTAEYVLTSADVIRGKVDNQATVIGTSTTGGEQVTDLSDDLADPTDNDSDGDGDADDVTTIELIVSEDLAETGDVAMISIAIGSMILLAAASTLKLARRSRSIGR